MPIPENLIINADDLGYNSSVNKAIFFCFEQGYINSTSLMTNTIGYEEAVDGIRQNPFVKNIGLHINLIRGKPLSNFTNPSYLNENGEWDRNKTNRLFNFFDTRLRSEFSKEIHAQIDKALADKIPISHLDSHLHLHNLPCFYKLFLEAAKFYNIKLRLAQTYNSGNYIKFLYRQYINNVIKKSGHSYSDYFVTVASLFDNSSTGKRRNGTAEIMLHPAFDANGMLIDSFDDPSLKKWLFFLQNQS